MKHEEVPPVPFTGWIHFSQRAEPVEVYAYDLSPGASVKSFAYREKGGGRVRCPVGMVELTQETVEAQINKDLHDTVEYSKSIILEEQEHIREAKEHPLWRD